jgi:hypothetical protein
MPINIPVFSSQLLQILRAWPVSPSGIQKCTAAMWDRAVCVFLDTPLAQSVSVFLKAYACL